MQFTISVPATSANIGPGYDVWGLSLSIRNNFTVKLNEISKRTSGKTKIRYRFSPLVEKTCDKALLASLADGSDNLIVKSINFLIKRAGGGFPGAEIICDLGIPLARGLGSSSTAILAGLHIANEFLRAKTNKCYRTEELFQIAARLEGHPDNIAPALFGGFIGSTRPENSFSYKTFQISMNAPIKLAGIIPHFQLATSDARQLVPKEVSTDSVAFHASRTAALSLLFAKTTWQANDYELFQTCLEEKIHQKQRAEKIPGMMQTFAYWKKLGAIGSYLSGAGTTLMAFWPKELNLTELDLGWAMRAANQQCTAIRPALDHEGTYLSWPNNN